MRNPSDPVYSGSLSDCVYGLADEGAYGSVAEAATTTRAAATRYFAGEMGVDVADVKCHTTYGRFLTRQDVWEGYGMDRCQDDLIEERGLEAKYDPSVSGLAAFWYETEDGERVLDSELEPPAMAPLEWEPGDEDPVWTECAKSDVGAVRIYVLDLR